MARRATPNIAAGSDVKASEKGMESSGMAPDLHPAIAQSRQVGGIGMGSMSNDSLTKVVMAKGTRRSSVD